MPTTHEVPPERVHSTWDAGNEPVVEIESGDPVVVETRDVTDIRVAGARPGDTLAVEVVELTTRSSGFAAIIPGLGLLGEPSSPWSVLRDDGRLPGRCREPAGHAARPLGREPRQAIATLVRDRSPGRARSFLTACWDCGDD